IARYSSAKKAAAAAAWRHIFDYIVATASERVAVLDRVGQTPAERRALTSLVDRLERRGLAKRVAKDCDRRVKDVVLTAKGKRIRSELLASQYTPPSDLMALPQRDLDALRAAASKLPARRPQP